MKNQGIFIKYCLSNMFIVFFIFIYGFLYKIWPFEFYAAIFIFIVTLAFGRWISSSSVGPDENPV